MMYPGYEINRKTSACGVWVRSSKEILLELFKKMHRCKNYSTTTYLIATHVVVKDVSHLLQMIIMNLIMLLVNFEDLFEKFSNEYGKIRKAVKRKIKILRFDISVEYAPIEID